MKLRSRILHEISNTWFENILFFGTINIRTQIRSYVKLYMHHSIHNVFVLTCASNNIPTVNMQKKIQLFQCLRTIDTSTWCWDKWILFPKIKTYTIPMETNNNFVASGRSINFDKIILHHARTYHMYKPLLNELSFYFVIMFYL
jgi:hypothetical protein